jgi:hypothetical protein
MLFWFKKRRLQLFSVTWYHRTVPPSRVQKRAFLRIFSAKKTRSPDRRNVEPAYSLAMQIINLKKGRAVSCVFASALRTQ